MVTQATVEEPTGHAWVLAAMLAYALAVEGSSPCSSRARAWLWAASYSAPLEIARSSRQGLCLFQWLQSLGGSVSSTCRMAMLPVYGPSPSAWWASELHTGDWERLHPLRSAEQRPSCPVLCLAPGHRWQGRSSCSAASIGLTAGHTDIITQGTPGTPARDRV